MNRSDINSLKNKYQNIDSCIEELNAIEVVLVKQFEGLTRMVKENEKEIVKHIFNKIVIPIIKDRIDTRKNYLISIKES